MDLDIISRESNIKIENLSRDQYTLSLLKEGFRMGIISKTQIENIQMNIMLLLKDLILRNTKGESTSVSVETAERILNSIYFSIDAYLEEFKNPKESIDILKTAEIKEIYENGIGIVVSCVEDAEGLYAKIKKNKLDVPVQAYNDTIDEISVFFKNYGILFNALDIIASIDYPLVSDEICERGAFYIKKYLENLDIETEFCNLFPNEDIISILKDYGRMYRIDYKASLINIFEILINNCIFSVLSGNSAYILKISKMQFDVLNRRLYSLSSIEVSSIINAAVEKVIDEFSLVNSKLCDYIKKYKPVFVQRVVNALKNENLNNVAVIYKEKIPDNNGIILEEGEKMNNERFRLIVDRIAKCSLIDEKIDIIKSEIHALTDFIDILDADCIFEDEFNSLFSTLSDIELSVLARIILSEDERGGLLKVSLSDLANKKVEIEWQINFIEFIQELKKGRIKEIDGYLCTWESYLEHKK